MNSPLRPPFANLGQLVKWPAFLPQFAEDGILEHVWAQPLEVDASADLVRARTTIRVDRELVLSIPGLDAVALTVAAAGGGTEVALEVEIVPQLFIRVIDVPLALRLKSDLFRPVRRVGTPQPGQPPQFEADPDAHAVDIELGRVTVEVNADGGISVHVAGSIELPPCMLGESNIVIEAHGVTLHLDPDAPPAGKPVGWRGVHIGSAALYLPGELAGIVGSLTLTDAYIGNGGFSGTVGTTWTPPLGASLFGMEFALKQVSLTFVQNALTAGSIIGEATLPFFDTPLEVEICPNLSGSFLVRLTSAGGLVTLTKPGVLTLAVESLGFKVEGSVFTVLLSGKIRPLIGDIDWPAFAVRELAIDSQGHVRLDGGWLDLPDQYALDFYGFKFEITKIGFGNSEDGGKWIGFSGGLKLVEGLSAGASVEGLRLTWYSDTRPVRVTLEGVGVELLVPSTLRLKGTIAYRELKVGTEVVHRFDGRVKLELLALDMSIDATLVVGTASAAGDTYTFLAIYLDVELPAGIPLGPTGICLYGMAGLFALSMEPDKHADEEWYGIGAGEGWYHRGTPGVTDLAAKWVNRRGSLALGAGVTLGTMADNGFTFSGKVLLVIVFPGPIIMLEGKANILRERAGLDGEAMFRALAVLDGRAGSLLFGLDAHYQYGDGGELIEIRGSVEAFFSFADASAWHLYLGMREPRDKRIRAHILNLFEANSYFMLDARQVALGSWVGYDKSWRFGPLRVTVEAWIEGNAALSWKPVHLHGDLWLHGKAELSVFGFGIGLSVDARFEAEVFDPFHVLASFAVSINLPWPLPDFDATIELEWGPDPVDPPLPMPLKEIAVEHFKVTESWPLPRGGATPLLLPNYDTDGDGFRANPVPDVATQKASAAPAYTPVVPLDARPHLTFGRAVHDLAKVGVNALPVVPEYERIGDPEQNQGPVKVKYSLTEVALDKWGGAGWIAVARKGMTPNPPGVAALYGSWAPVPAMPDGHGENPAQVKLWLWSKSAFDYTRHSGRAWEDWFTARFDGYPCPPPLQERTLCCDFERIDPGTPLAAPWRCPAVPFMQLIWFDLDEHVVMLPTPVRGKKHGLCFDQRGPLADFGIELFIELGVPVDEVRILVTEEIRSVTAVGFDKDGLQYGPFVPKDNLIVVTAPSLTRVRLSSRMRFCVLEVCVTIRPTLAEVKAREEMIQHQQDELARWSQEGDVLEPYTTYRLAVATHIGTTDNPIGDFDHVEFGYFRTEGPPGLVNPSPPIGSGGQFQSALRDLSRYVRQTIPRTVPGRDEKPPLPRPVYRGYDVGVEFNENYVDLMYRISRRDLGLYLFDNNNQPVRDAAGRLVILTNRWGHAPTLALAQTDTHWISTINASSCVSLDSSAIPHSVVLAAASAALVLAADTLYEARLVPLLLHDAFAGPALGAAVGGPAGVLDGWLVQDQGTNLAPSRWEIREAGTPPARYIVQTTDIWGGSVDGRDPVKPGAMLLRADNPALPAGHSEQPGNWTDYRFSVYLRSEDDDAIGVVFRFVDINWHYRFAMDRERGYRRLLRVAAGATTILAADDFVYQKNRDYLVTVEAIGSSLRVYMDGAPVFAVDDATMHQGRIGLYCWANAGARFSDVTVDDYRADAPVPYRFKFTTSGFANFFHHLHSFQDETWRITLPAGIDIAPQVAAAAAPTTEPTEPEARAYLSLAGAVGKFGDPPAGAGQVRISRIEQNGVGRALLVECAEPIDWARASVAFMGAARQATAGAVPGVLKLADVSFAAAAVANDESVTLLLRDAASPADWAIEHWRIPGPLALPQEGALLFRDDFEGGDRGLLFREAFGPNALDRYAIVDEGTDLGPSAWSAAAGLIQQKSNVYGGSLAAADAAKPGTYAVVGDADWRDVRIGARVSATDDDGIGIAFRWQDQDNYYRFSMDAERGFRRLVKKTNGVVTVLWEEGSGYIVNRIYDIDIVAVGDCLSGFLDNEMLFSVRDGALRRGAVGLYCWANEGAQFHALTVERVAAPYVLWQPALADMDGFEVVVENGAVGLPVQWSAAGGVLRQTAAVFTPDATAHKPGTYALAGDARWSDLELSAVLESGDPAAFGIMFRYVDRDNYYRFSIDAGTPYRRLISKVGGVVTVLWDDAIGTAQNVPHRLTVRARGPRLTGFLDGQPLFDVYSAALVAGRVGFYAWGNADARFSRILVADATRHLGDWTIRDEGVVGGPSEWRMGGGALRQLSAIGGGAAPDDPGTYAVAPGVVQDCRVRVRLLSDSGAAIGVAFRMADTRNYYRFSLGNGPGYRRLVKRVDDAVTVLWQDSAGYTTGTTLEWTFDITGTVIAGYLGEDLVFRVVDASLSAGAIALYAAGNTSARFTDVELRVPPLHAYALFEDHFAHGDMAAWTVVDEGTLAGPSAWSIVDGAVRQTEDIHSPPNDRDTLDKPGTLLLAGDPAWRDYVVTVRLGSNDDDSVGVVFRYADATHFLRFSWDRQRAYRRLVKNVGGVYTLLWEDDVAYELGREYELTFAVDGPALRGYVDGVPMFVVDDYAIPAGRIGLYTWGNDFAWFRNVAVYPGALLAGRHLLDDPLRVEVARRWSPFDEGDLDAPSAWSVTDGWMTQGAAIRDSGAPDSPDKPGTYNLTGAPDWSDYRLTLQMKSETSEGIGVLFRYRDANNFYRFSMDATRKFRRLVRKAEGVTTVLWEDHNGYVPGHPYLATIDCMGPRITAYLDGLWLFAVDDPAHASGRIGLYSWGNSAARFNEVRVTAACWMTYFQFGAEEPRSAGKRIQVLSGNVADAASAPALVDRRFRATLGDRGRARLLPREAAPMRLVSPLGAAGHRKVFLDPVLYAPFDFTVLRKADRTAFFLFAPEEAPPATRLEPAQYQLRFTYRRDNRRHQPESQLLSEAGESSDEIVTIDIPWTPHG
jgi:hypothetical protein